MPRNFFHARSLGLLAITIVVGSVLVIGSARKPAAGVRVKGSANEVGLRDSSVPYFGTRDPRVSYLNTDITKLRQEAKLTADNGAASGLFGWSVAISGNTAIIGAAGQGVAYVYVRSNAGWSQQAELSVPGSFVGEAVAISGDTAIVGARADDSYQGAAYIFVRTGTTWSQQQRLLASDGAANDNFGWAVAVSGDTAVVSAPYYLNAHGAAYVFSRSGATWEVQDVLTANSPQQNDFFGASLGIDGATIIAGVPGDNVVPGSGVKEGSAYVFLRTAVWSLQKVLTAPEQDSSFNFGQAVAISNDRAIVGSRDAAYEFNRDGTWSSPQPLAPNPGEALTGDGYGESVGISGNTAIVGAFRSNSFQGAAYVFTANGSVWSEEEKLLANDGAANDNFAYAVAVDGDLSIIGAESDDVGANVDQGSAYAFLRIHDVDGDGLPDDWEANGITVASGGVVSVGDTGNGVYIDLPAMGANPNHKDVFIHADWMRSDPARPGVTFKPSWRALKIVTDAFAIAPVTNPDGTAGLNLHLDLGSDSVMNPVTNEMWGTFSRAGDVPFQESVGVNDIDGGYNWSEVDTIKQAHFQITRRNLVFHYALFANTFANEPNGGLARGIPGADFLVTLGHPLWTTPGGTVLEQAGTVMHELGHNLGLRHGGNDNINTKPNYLSVMNYAFQNTGLLLPNGQQRSFDYSRLALPTLNERNLNEAVGISDPNMHFTLWSKRTRLDVPPGANKCISNPDGYFSLLDSPATDWDCDATRASTPVSADINGDGICISGGANRHLDTVLAGDDEIRLRRIVTGPNRTCDTVAAGDDVQEQAVGFVEPDNLAGFADWPALIFDGGGKIGAFGATAVEPEVTSNAEPTVEQLFDIAPPGLVAAEATAPLDLVTISAPSGGAPLPVTFDGSGSTAVNGTITNYSWNFGDGQGTSGSAAIVMHTYASPGTYFASLTVTDSNGRMNLVPLLNRVIVSSAPPPSPTPSPTPSAPNLTPYQPAGWSDKLVVSNTTSTNTDSTPLFSTDALKVDFAIINNGGMATSSSFNAILYVDGIPVHNFTVNAMNASTYTVVEDFNIGTLSAGQHNIEIIADVNGDVVESDETDNHYSKIINVLAAPSPSPSPTPSPTPTPTPIAQTFTVKNTNDSGPDSLRQAIIDANSNPNPAGSIDEIAFNIPGPGVHTIAPATQLPAVSEAVLIDGYTQPGSSANTLDIGDNAVLLIELTGVNRVDVGLDLTGGNCTVRGLVINHFDAFIFTSLAIRLNSSNNVVAGNFFGSNTAGTAEIHNRLGVEVVSGANNLIGGTTPAARNIFAGNATNFNPATVEGVHIGTTEPGTRVQGNYIGTNAAGNAALGLGTGVYVAGSASADVTIGGLTSTPGIGAGNVISGNSSNGGVDSDGIFIVNRPANLLIQGNLIGLNASGTAALPNGVSGIHFQDAVAGTGELLVGGTVAGARNVVFNNRISGIISNAIGLNVQGNFIGTDITGLVRPLGSQDSSGDGILIGAGLATIGGDTAAARNVFSCHGRAIHLAGGSSIVAGNYIGLAADGNSLGNDREGIWADNDAAGTVGGTTSGQGNVIAHNFSAGVTVRNTARISVLGNSIFDNGTNDNSVFQGHPGIDLNDDGVTANDTCDSDTGPNGKQNYPGLISAVALSSLTRIFGSLNSKPNTTYRIEFFSNSECELSGHGEGKTYLGAGTVTTNSSCDGTVDVGLPFVVTPGLLITATATDPDGNTSEFSNCIVVEAPTASNGLVSGRITDEGGQPLAGTLVKLSGAQDRRTITTADGTYSFDNLETNGFYTLVPSRANFVFAPSQRSFSQLGQRTDVSFTALRLSDGLNPLDTTEFFVRQQYLDFLNREPDQGGWEYWTRQIEQCGSDQACSRRRRIDVSNAFFYEQEFQQTGAYVFRLYRAAFGHSQPFPNPDMTNQIEANKLPGYAVFAADRARVIGGAGLAQAQRNLADEFVTRPAFLAHYPGSLTGTQLVDALLTRMQADLNVDLSSQRTALIALVESEGKGALLYRIADDSRQTNSINNRLFIDAEYNRALVFAEYAGYLQRNPDINGFLFWLGQVEGAPLRDVGRQHAMVCSFLTSAEYQLRFSAVVSHSNVECR